MEILNKIKELLTQGFINEENGVLKESVIGNIFLSLGTSVLCFAASLLLLNSLGFFLGFEVSSLSVMISLVVSALFLIISAGKLSGFKWVPFGLLAFALIVLAGFYVMKFQSKVFDISYDGQAYHQEAIFQLVKGWNPVYKQLTSEEANNMHRLLNHYSKGPWIMSASIFKLTGQIETAKIFTPLFIIASFLIVASFLTSVRSINPVFSISIALLAALNPVSIYQSLSFYVDGQLMSLLICLISASAIVYLSKNSYSLWTLFSTLVILLNIKLTAVAYATILLAGPFLALFLKEKIDKLIAFSSVTVVSYFIGIVVIGFNPYVTNTLYKGNPLYPVVGSGAEAYIEGNMPENYFNKNPVSRLFSSAFSKSENVRGKGKFASLKNPFSVSPEETKAFGAMGAKVGGWGPLFGAALIISLLGFATLIALGKETKLGKSALLIIGLILISCFINPISSLARFVPQFYLIPLIISVFIFMGRGVFTKTFGIAVMAILIANNYLIAQSYFNYNFEMTKRWEEKLVELSDRSGEKALVIDFDQFRLSGMERFKNYGIDYIEAKSEECKNSARLFPESVIIECKEQSSN